MKRKTAIALLVVTVVTVGLIVWQRQAGRSSYYQGKSIREWALELSRTPDPRRNTNAATLAFQVLGSNAVPTLRTLAGLREPFYEDALVRHARKIPVKPRVFLYQKLKPGQNTEIRVGALAALGLIGPDALTALPEMLAALAETDSRVRWTAAQNISLLGPEVVPALIQLTTNSDTQLRHAAVYALGEARTNALPATLALLHNTIDTNESICASAFYSLSRIGRPALPTIVATAATNADPTIRNAALRSLIVITPPPGHVISSHLQTSTNSPEIRRLAILALSRSRLTNEHALNIFTNALSDEEIPVREAAALALDRIYSGRLLEWTNQIKTNLNPQLNNRQN